MENKICKIVYFDEDSVTDYVQIVAGGTLENTEELLKTRGISHWNQMYTERVETENRGASRLAHLSEYDLSVRDHAADGGFVRSESERVFLYAIAKSYE